MNLKPQDGLTFDPEDHTYRWWGERVPCVSDVMEPLNVHLRKIPKDILNRKAKFGTDVHKFLELYDTNKLTSIPPQLSHIVEQWQKFLTDNKLKILPEYVEFRYYNEELKYAGTLDRIAVNDKGGIFIIEIKTSKPLPTTSVQLWAYHKLTGLLFDRLVSFHIDVDIDYISIDHPPLIDYSVFDSCLSIYNFNYRR